MTPDQLAKSNSEHAHQRAFFAYCKYVELHGFYAADVWANLTPAQSSEPWPLLKWIHAIPNGAAYGHEGEGAKMKAEGLKAGVLDVAFDFPVDNFAGFKMEFKKPALRDPKNPKKGMSKEQIEYADFAHNCGHFVCLAYSWQEGVKWLKKYLNVQ